MPIDYSKSQIYKLCCNNLNVPEFYVGSTLAFRRRKAEHKYACNTETYKRYNLKLYQHIRANGGFECWDMVLIENFTTCTNKQELHARERWYIEQLKSTLNDVTPILSVEERRQNKIKTDRSYKELHKEEIGIYRKAYKQRIKTQYI